MVNSSQTPAEQAAIERLRSQLWPSYQSVTIVNSGNLRTTLSYIERMEREREELIASVTELANAMEPLVEEAFAEFSSSIAEKCYERDIKPVDRARAILAKLNQKEPEQ